jgi:DNA-binding protein Fis
LIQEALKRTNGNQTLAAALLGITRQTLHRRLNSKKV